MSIYTVLSRPEAEAPSALERSAVTCPSARHPRSGPTTWAACCAPPELTRARAQFKAGEIDADDLREVENQAIEKVIDLQHDAGLQTVTDGEFRRTSWHMDFIYALGRDRAGRGGDHPRPVPQRRRRVRLRAAGDAGRGQGQPAGDDLRRRVLVPARPRPPRTDAQAHHPLAEHGPLPRRQLIDRSFRIPGHGHLLGGPVQRLQRSDPRRVRARLPLPAARRHQPGLHQ